MARAVRKKELTAEERLAAALVPEEEQPYKVPGNWCWVRLGSVIEASKEKADIFEEGTRYVGLENIEKDTGVISCQMAESIKSTKTIFHEGDILYGKLRPYLNKHGIVDFDGVCSTDILAFNTKGTSINRYVDFYLHLPNFIESMVANSKGINLPRVSEKIVLSYPLPLAPISEQQRLVDIISSLFADLDEAKEKLTAVVEGFAQRKAAILHQAFTGELTAKWREEKKPLAIEWKKIELKDVLVKIKYGTSSKSDYNKTDFPVLRIPNIAEGRLDFSDMKYLPNPEENCRVKKGDILIIRSNGSRNLVGKCALVPEVDGEMFYASFLICITPSEKILPEYLVRFLNSEDARKQTYIKAKSSAGIHNVNSQELKSLKLNLPCLDEQREIVRILDDLFEQEQQAQSAVETVLADIDTLKKSILARAFRGELSTNDQGEENAVEMLKEVMKKG